MQRLSSGENLSLVCIAGVKLIKNLFGFSYCCHCPERYYMYSVLHPKENLYHKDRGLNLTGGMCDDLSVHLNALK